MKRNIAVYHEHPHWFKPLFAELDKRGLEYCRLDACQNRYDPCSSREADLYSLVFNRMSPSAYLRGAGNSILYTFGYLIHLERLGLQCYQWQPRRVPDGDQ